MNVTDAINTLIAAANIAHNKGAYTLEESHHIYMAIAELNSLNQQAQQTQETSQPITNEEVVNAPQENQNFVDSSINVTPSTGGIFNSPGIS